MKKDDVEFHNASRFGQQYPAINVKMYRGRGTVPPDANDIIDKFGCSESTAEKAREYVIDSATEQFWEEMKSLVTEIFGSVKVYSAGRSGGWLIVEGLPEVEHWDAVMLGKWAKLRRVCREEMKYLCAKDYFFEMIEANHWAEEGAERYNFYDTKDGKSVCISEMKAKAKEAGFGSVVRP